MNVVDIGPEQTADTGFFRRNLDRLQLAGHATVILAVGSLGIYSVLNSESARDEVLTDQEQEDLLADYREDLTPKDRFIMEFVDGGRVQNPDDRSARGIFNFGKTGAYADPNFFGEFDEEVGQTCLQDTPYDPKNGAKINTKGNNLNVKPKDKEFPVLQLENVQDYDEPLAPRNYATYLVFKAVGDNCDIKEFKGPVAKKPNT